jgi:argininosuccinate lyase
LVLAICLDLNELKIVMAENKKQATWGGRFSEGPNELMQTFSESVSFDARLAPFDIEGSLAHARMLKKVGLLTGEELASLETGFAEVMQDIIDGKLEWDPALEDVHMNIEQALTQKTPVAAKLHMGRSRNDQVATDMRLYFRETCLEIIHQGILPVQEVLLELAEDFQDVIIPGYTHLQRAQPVSVAHHFLAYVEMFNRDEIRFFRVMESAQVCPLGSGAIAGTTLPIDREYTAELLRFTSPDGLPMITYNSMDAVSDRDVFIEFLSACALCGVHFSRLAEDLILWCSSEFNFIRLPDAFTTGSSLMPQKKNPDSLELLRGKAARLQGNLQTMLTMVKGLPLTYNRDLQEDKPPVFDSADTTMMCLKVLAGTLHGASMNEDACAKAVSDPLLLATDLADYLVLRGLPFRQAHHAVGAMVAASEETNTPLNELPDNVAKEICPDLGDDWRDVFDLKRAFAAREKPGMPGPQQIQEQIEDWKEKIEDDRDMLGIDGEEE